MGAMVWGGRAGATTGRVAAGDMADLPRVDLPGKAILKGDIDGNICLSSICPYREIGTVHCQLCPLVIRFAGLVPWMIAKIYQFCLLFQQVGKRGKGSFRLGLGRFPFGPALAIGIRFGFGLIV